MKLYKEIDFCLLIPCYNNFDGLIVSLQSVIYPTGNFLILIIDDGSREIVTKERIKNEMKVEKPIVLLQNEKNLGITATLNKGLHWIEENTDARYIARLDCGDICLEERFVLQVQYMDAHEEIGLTGSWCQFQDRERLEKYSYKTPVYHSDILRAMYYRNVFIHPTVMFRRLLLQQSGYYPEGFEYAEDYAFFWKLIKIQPSFVFDKFLVICELNKGGLSYKNKGKQLIARWRVIKTFGSNLALKITAGVRLIVLFVLPKEITLQLKKWRR